MSGKFSPKTERELADYIGSFRTNFSGLVMALWPWGQPFLSDGSHNPLANKTGPEPWQSRLLANLDHHMQENAIRKLLELDFLVWRSARASGHGVGKSALVAQLIIMLMSTRPDCRGIVTSNTGDQLENKTWPELGKWHDLALNKHWFGRTATTFYFAAYPEEKRKNYAFTAQTVSPERTEAFAGLHNEASAAVMIMDEASAIAAKVTEVAEGAMTDGEPFMFKFGNPTRPDGDFYDCFNHPVVKQMYDLEAIDSRDVSFTNKTAINDMLRKWGPDSDEAKVRVYGQFPSVAFDGFISPAIATEAMMRELWEDHNAPLVIGVDVARFGNDRSVIFGRRGRDARNPVRWEFRGLSTTDLAKKVMDYCSQYKPDGIVIESIGPGAGVIDTLRTYGYKVVEVHPGEPAPKGEPYDRLRSKWWSLAREWIYAGGCLPDDKELFGELTKISYALDTGGETKLKLEPKKLMKERLGFSPDLADAFVLTFAATFRRRDGIGHRPQILSQAVIDYDMYAI